MKRYTSKVVSKWIAAENFIGKVRKAKPFPGKAPTRIMLSASSGNRSFMYLGKPSREAKRAFDNFVDRPCLPESFMMYVEFDRGGIISFTRMQDGRLPHRTTNNILWAHYHQEVMAENLPTWLRFPYVVKDKTYRLA